jgi:hypothetical protein
MLLWIVLSVTLADDGTKPPSPPNPPDPSTSATDRRSYKGYLALSKADRERGREDVTVWDSFLSKARCLQAIKDAKHEDALPPAHTTCFGSNCYESRCIGDDCYVDEAGASRKGLRYCEYGRVNLKPGTQVKAHDDAPEECGPEMRRVALSGKWTGHDGCVLPENLSRIAPSPDAPRQK